MPGIWLIRAFLKDTSRDPTQAGLGGYQTGSLWIMNLMVYQLSCLYSGKATKYLLKTSLAFLSQNHCGSLQPHTWQNSTEKLTKQHSSQDELHRGLSNKGNITLMVFEFCDGQMLSQIFKISIDRAL
ncbi:hypothetical protein CHS0354_003548 [Potamilus streckersoni]|uniref:Protein kinase domain-containing protein n=1 Tax=Potamilus streckersoni TaxID=2493646 RepID=A0AAE0RV95_9BIVA|nr:hypothetical protein CHS0354_003548 [Potamilus streckersoni]